MAELYGIIGYPLTHTFSPAFFREKFAREGIPARYEAFPLPAIEGLPGLWKQHPDLRGLNVTAPYKTAVLPFLDQLAPDAEALGAVNCILKKEGRLWGYNTDWQAFADSLPPLPAGTSALVLGNGGAAQAIRFALGKMQVTCSTLCRQAVACDFTFDTLEAASLQRYRLLINATTLGTLGQGKPRLPYAALLPDQMMYDLVYNPPLTPFLEEGQRRGLWVKNGLDMLHRQALLSWDIWQAEGIF